MSKRWTLFSLFLATFWLQPFTVKLSPTDSIILPFTYSSFFCLMFKWLLFPKMNCVTRSLHIFTWSECVKKRYSSKEREWERQKVAWIGSVIECLSESFLFLFILSTLVFPRKHKHIQDSFTWHFVVWEIWPSSICENGREVEEGAKKLKKSGQRHVIIPYNRMHFLWK